MLHLQLQRESVIYRSFTFFSIGGVALVSISSMDNDKGVTGIHGRSELSIRLFYDCLFLDLIDYCVIIGSLWSLVGAMLYAVYIVMIKRRVDREDKLDIPMFFGEGTSSLYIFYKCEAFYSL